MGKWMFALLALIIVAVSGCASTGGKSASSASLPEIMPYDEVAVDPLPDFVPAQL